MDSLEVSINTLTRELLVILMKDIPDLNEGVKNKVKKQLQEFLEKVNHVEERLVWLEDAIDRENIDIVFVPYQKKFNLGLWSGGPM